MPTNPSTGAPRDGQDRLRPQVGPPEARKVHLAGIPPRRTGDVVSRCRPSGRETQPHQFADLCRLLGGSTGDATMHPTDLVGARQRACPTGGRISRDSPSLRGIRTVVVAPTIDLALFLEPVRRIASPTLVGETTVRWHMCID